MSNAPVTLNEKTVRDLATSKTLEGLSGTILMELLAALYDLEQSRRYFRDAAERMKKDLEEAIHLAGTPGRFPNQCGVTQGAPSLEVFNGQISARTERVNALARIAVKAGLLPAAVYVA